MRGSSGVVYKHRAPPSVGNALVWFVGAYAVAIGGYIVLNASAARLLGPQSFGSFVIVLTACTAVGQVALVGVHRSGLREAARLDAGDAEGLGRLRAGVRAVCWTTLPLAGLATGVLGWILASDRSNSERAALAVTIGLLVVLTGQHKLVANYLRGMGRIRLASVLEGRAGGPVVGALQSSLVLAVLLLAPGLGLAGALGAVTLGFLVPVLIGWWQLGSTWRAAPIEGRVADNLRRVVRRDWKFAGVQLGAFLNSNLEIWLAGLVLTQIDTSMFSAAQRIAVLLAIPITSLQVVFSPAIARMAAEGNLQRLERLLRTGATIATAGSVLLWLPMLIAPGIVTDLLLGDQFDQAAFLVVLLSVGYMVNVVTGLCGPALSMTHREGVVASAQWIGVALRLGCGLAAALLWGVQGLAISATVITAAIFLSLAIQVRVRVGVRTHPTLRPNRGVLRRTQG